MAQYDIHRNADKNGARLFPFVVDVQHDLHRLLESRVVIPLTAPENLAHQPLLHLNPVLRVEGRALLRHDEHSTIELPPGTFHVRRQSEYSPAAIRSVAD